MKVGDEKTVRIEAEDAYGPINLEARQSVPRSNIPDSVPLEIGLQLQAQTENGQTMLTTLAYSASLPAIAIGLIFYVSATSGLVF